ncbi:MAG: hypothetical protein HQ567_25780 [Candidatus Nealsonbacteria bacterium]|nr:hypothetical protein [Candidatus Nealsonbacteria bacterium]
MPARRHFKPGERIGLELTAAERKLLLDGVLLLDDDNVLSQAIRDAPPDQPAFLTLDELEQLVENLAAASKRAEDQTTRAEIDRLYDKVDALIDSFSDEE